MTTQSGGKTVYGATVGILMLETRFPRIPGDMGNARTWPFPVQYRVVRGASPDRVVRGDPRALLPAFVAAGRDLVAMGCDGITTNCGFLSLVQEELREALGVPVATSSLMQVPMVQAMLPPGKRAVILTISRATLSPDHLKAAGVAPDTPIYGTDGGCAFTRDILGDAAEIDFAACRQDMLDAADEIMADCPEAGAIVLECTNMVPYATDIRRRTGLPVWSIESFVHWFQAGLLPRRFPTELDDPRH
ncbi:aspartate/glutamate racemase family protein [Jhaorihella thermophila]|uniref:Aspartate/glutamate racemase family protein n=1 Tax=Jhaorihella thermophila TaxID=488547 RepID=A0A1H5XWN6_9RHOB|nr:aspartate/glutamate racemase family protein [Jhaorihella thermophila]SEG16111.1 hypothetical protein SAMN05421751_11328 [Jhaorihella thermophila]